MADTGQVCGLTGRCPVCTQAVGGKPCESHASPWYPYEPRPCTIHTGMIVLHEHGNPSAAVDGAIQVCIGTGTIVRPVTG